MNTRCYVVYFAGLNCRSWSKLFEVEHTLCCCYVERQNTRCVVMSRGRIHVVLLLYCLSKQQQNNVCSTSRG